MSQHAESGGGQCAACGFRGEDNLAHYSPWSCSTIGPCLRPFDPDALDHKSAPSCAERPVRPRRGHAATRGACARPLTACFLAQELDGTAGGDGKRWLDRYRRLKDEDPIIPFSEAPIISKWGAISRAARAGFHAGDPIQAAASTAAMAFKGASRPDAAAAGALAHRCSSASSVRFRLQTPPGAQRLQVELQRLRLLQPLQLPGEVRHAAGAGGVLAAP